jgi:CRP-like cAMP-binding protein
MSSLVSQITMFNGEVLFRQNQPAKHFYLVQSGMVMVLDQSGTKIIRYYEADQMFGLPEVLAGIDWPHTVIAYSKTVVKIFAADIVFDRMEHMPQAHQHFMKQMAHLSI